MCGITGIWHFNEVRIDNDEISNFNNSLSHRGPDGGYVYIEHDNNIGLGHRRLSIIDLSKRGNQPMQSKDKRYWIVYNGEVYNFIELRKELKELGHSFESDSDTEVILEAYSEWGTKCLSKFNGMWAFAIWDRKNKRLFLARDRFGVKPLHYLCNENMFAFASETISFKYLKNYHRKINDNNLQKALINPFSTEGYGHTIFDGIFQILPGHYIEIEENTKAIKQKRWWSTLSNTIDKLPESYESRIENFKDIFRDACKIRMRSDVPIGTALSGGIDSSAIYCMINDLMKNNGNHERIPDNWQKAFVHAFPGTSLDESAFAKKVIDCTKGDAVYITPKNEEIAENIISSTILFDGIYATPIYPASEIYKAMRRDGIKVSLDGHGVDEMMFGYSSLLEKAYKYMKQCYNEKELEKIFGSVIDKDALIFNRNDSSRIKNIIKSFVPSKIIHLKLFLENLFNAMPKMKSDRMIYLGESDSQFSELNELNKIAFDSFHLSTLPTILRNFDRASMQNGVEIRMPFIDWRLVTYVFSLPFTDKIGGKFNKKILRDSMYGIMPEEIRKRKTKIGLNAPMIEWFTGPMKELIMDSVSSQTFQSSSLWNGKKLKKVTERHMKERSWSWVLCSRLWPYINAVILMENNKKI